MSQIFISHSSKNNPAALALRDWLRENGWGENRVFLDIDPKAGISPGERWEKALQDAADRCEAVVFLVSPEWLASRWCLDEFRLTRHLKKKIIGVVVAPVPLENIPAEMTREWQLCKLNEAGETTRFAPRYKGKTYAIKFSSAGLALLKIGLEKAGLAASTFAFKAGRSPYPGLRPLEEDDAAIFFGRSAEIIRALDELRGLREAGNKQLFVIQGASGTGKSSFLRAGLMARLRRDDENFLVLPTIRPETAVLTGDNGLAASLAGAAASLGLKFARGDIAKRLGDNKGFTHILEMVKTAAQKRNAVSSSQPPAVVLPIDQAEELFNPGAEIEARAFLVLLNALKQFRGSALAVATIRSDRYDSLQSAEEISSLTQHPFNLPPIPSAFFSQIIEGPAERRTAAGARLEIAPELTARMLEDIKGEGEAMPLIAFTMHQLFKNYGEDGMLDADEYAALGGIKGSIDRAIAEACRDPGNAPAITADAAGQERGLRRTFIPHLVRLHGAASTPLRQIVVESTLPVEVQAYTKRLVGQSVLTRNARAGLTTVEIAHESVLRLWDRLNSWLTQETDKLKIRDTIKNAAAEWLEKGKSADFLIHTGSRLADAERLARDDDYRADLGADGEAYIRACRSSEDAEREMERQRLARLARWQRVVYALLVSIIAGLIGWINQAYLKEQVTWFTTVRPYLLAQVWPHVLTAEAEKALKPGDSFKECAKDCPEMAVLPAGEFMMGSPPDEQGRDDNEGPQHKVVLARPFAVSRFEVSLDDWDACVAYGDCEPKAADSDSEQGRKPVVNLTWEDAQRYVTWFARMTSKPYRLLSEAEWEYAARAGTQTAYSWGESIGQGNANCVSCGSQWDAAQAAPVGSFAPNAFGLSDMHGNVWEWVEDCYHDNYHGAPTDSAAWTAGGDCSRRVGRGGSWSYAPRFLRSALRSGIPSDLRSTDLGFRIGRTLTP